MPETSVSVSVSVESSDALSKIAKQVDEIHRYLFNDPSMRRFQAEHANRPARIEHTYFGPQSIPSRTEIFR